ncbi:targeting protein for XKLP2 isoform X2 [Wolffia australiana]
MEGGAGVVQSTQIDDLYEFRAPKFFDFLNGETVEQIEKAELWFETALSYAQSPFINGVKGRRSYKQESICCDFGEIEEQKPRTEKPEDEDEKEIPVIETKSTAAITTAVVEEKVEFKEEKNEKKGEEHKESAVDALPEKKVLSEEDLRVEKDETVSTLAPGHLESKGAEKTPRITREPEKMTAEKGSRNRSAKKIANLIKNTSALKPRTQQPTSAQKVASIRDIAQENQAVKRQKLEGGLSRQIHNVKNRQLIHKSRPDLPADGNDLLCAARQINKREEMQAAIQRRPKLMLTRPKEPDFETTHRIRAVRIKSSAELEEEMLSKMPKFKARPINKKILEAPTLPTPQRSIPHPPEFQEFNLKTMERASRNAQTSSVLSSSMESSAFHEHAKVQRLTEPRMPRLETSLRARPPRVKSTQELELEELEKVPKFKARPLNKKIFEAKEDCENKPKRRQITVPQEFHFATDQRLGPPPFVLDAFDKLSLHSEGSRKDHCPIKLTVPNPFHLHTEERGLLKERNLSVQIQRKETEQEMARVPKANPYPYTTDYPVVPPKPAPKECTKPDVFLLESIVRHEEVMQKKREEQERMEREEAEKRVFKAQPVLTKDPFPTVKKERKPLTEVQGFDLHVEHRARDRAEFEKKVKEKEALCKRMREENEVLQKVEEEREVKQMRKTMVPTPLPLPNFANPFLPQKSNKEVTKARSPALKVAMRLMMRRQQLHSQTTSLSQMR